MHRTHRATLLSTLLALGGTSSGAGAEDPCLPGAKLIKRAPVEQCVTPDGRLHGLVRVRSEKDGKIVLEQRWVNGQMDGPLRTWHDDGKPATEAWYKAEKPDGAWKAWWPSGVLADETQYKAGVRTGTWTLYFASGKPAWQRVYGVGGKLKSEAIFDESGKRNDRELTAGVVARVMHGEKPA